MPGVGTAPPGDLVLAWLALARRTALRPGGERQAVASADITWGATLRGGLSESGEYTTLSPEPRLPASESQLAELLGSASLERFHWANACVPEGVRRSGWSTGTTTMSTTAPSYRPTRPEAEALVRGSCVILKLHPGRATTLDTCFRRATHGSGLTRRCSRLSCAWPA